MAEAQEHRNINWMFHRGCASQDLWWATTSPPPCRPIVFFFDSALVSCNKPFVRAASLKISFELPNGIHIQIARAPDCRKKGREIWQKHKNIGTYIYIYRFQISKERLLNTTSYRSCLNNFPGHERCWTPVHSLRWRKTACYKKLAWVPRCSLLDFAVGDDAWSRFKPIIPIEIWSSKRNPRKMVSYKLQVSLEWNVGSHPVGPLGWLVAMSSYPGLIADSTMPSNSTVLQQMYPDFVQVETGGVGWTSSERKTTWRWKWHMTREV